MEEENIMWVRVKGGVGEERIWEVKFVSRCVGW